VEILMQRTPAVQLQHTPIRRRRTIECDPLPGQVGGGIHLLGGRSGHDEARQRDVEAVERLARAGAPAL
jgi:hypothetical protein